MAAFPSAVTDDVSWSWLSTDSESSNVHVVLCISVCQSFTFLCYNPSIFFADLPRSRAAAASSPSLGYICIQPYLSTERNMAMEKEAVKTQIKTLIPGTKEHKARAAGDPAYHLGNVGSKDHRIHTGYGLTGKVHPKTSKARDAKDNTKGKLTKHVHAPHHDKAPAAHNTAPIAAQNSSGANRVEEKPTAQ
ncbi:hypothetical protein COO60DRAFT_1528129 [Scenedesmus sp. NREL 46B-D3]|nr:hypothetical protein COO60DRAFT_1528129 [Scenedesmus sp. NREL 46B-D3]